jgi:crossover junction endodeoxyribonuclease RuvC
MINTTSVVGVDPGFSGAIGIICDNGHVEVHDMPVLGEGAQKFVDGHTLRELLLAANPCKIVIEQVSARPGQGVSTMFRFGAAYGAVVAIATSIGCPVAFVTPVRWKRKMGLVNTSKEASRALAIRTFPGARDSLKRKKDDGRAEGLLLADYGRQYVH